jgi:hypothetical protein
MNPRIHRAVSKKMDVAGREVRIRLRRAPKEQHGPNEAPQAYWHAPQAAYRGVHGHVRVRAAAHGEGVAAVLKGHRRRAHARGALTPGPSVRGARRRRRRHG